MYIYRELWEESGLTVNELQEAGVLKFEYLGEPEILEVHVFTTSKFEGKPTESEGTIPYIQVAEVATMVSFGVAAFQLSQLSPEGRFFWVGGGVERRVLLLWRVPCIGRSKSTTSCRCEHIHTHLSSRTTSIFLGSVNYDRLCF